MSVDASTRPIGRSVHVLGSAPITRSGRSALSQARQLWQDAFAQSLPADRYRLAHLAALRATAGLLAVGSAPSGRLAARPTSAWVLVPKMAPEFAQWSAYFAGGVAQRAAADAGVVNAVSPAEADELLEAVRTYLFLVDAVVAGAGIGEESVFDPAAFPPPSRSLRPERAG